MKIQIMKKELQKKNQMKTLLLRSLKSGKISMVEQGTLKVELFNQNTFPQLLELQPKVAKIQADWKNSSKDN